VIIKLIKLKLSTPKSKSKNRYRPNK